MNDVTLSHSSADVTWSSFLLQVLATRIFNAEKYESVIARVFLRVEQPAVHQWTSGSGVLDRVRVPTIAVVVGKTLAVRIGTVPDHLLRPADQRHFMQVKFKNLVDFRFNVKVQVDPRTEFPVKNFNSKLLIFVSNFKFHVQVPSPVQNCGRFCYDVMRIM